MKKDNWHLVIVAFVMLAVSLFFYPTLWRQIIHPSPSTELVVQGESPVYEFVAETVRHNILSGRNPFAETEQVLYPHGWKFALDDVAPINGFWFLLLRPWLSIHQSLMLIVLVSVIATGLTTYALLRQLRIQMPVSLLISLVLAFSPFVSERIAAHPTYVALYLFSLPSLCFVRLVIAKRVRDKIVAALFLALSLVLVPLTNLYFAVMLAMLILILFLMYTIFSWHKTWEMIGTNWRYLLLCGMTTFLLLSPWLLEVKKVILYQPADIPKDWNDILTYSTDVTNLIIPSKYNPLYQPIVQHLSNSHRYIANIFEDFSYPGIILLVSMCAYIFLSKRLSAQLLPVFVSALAFLLLMFGPYLKVAGHLTNLPLPYMVLTKIPYIQMARAPGRFVAPFLFLVALLAAYVVQYLVKKYRLSARAISAGLFVLFLLDQRVRLPPPTTITLPTTIYAYLAQQGQAPLLEIPFAIRDSIKYHGSLHTHWSVYGTLLHKQPIFGVYAGRVNNATFAYFTNNPILGPLGLAIDPKTADPENHIVSIDTIMFMNAANFYHLEHIILKNNESYSQMMAEFLARMGYAPIMHEQAYDLWYRKAAPTSVSSVDFDGTTDSYVLMNGWSSRDHAENSRWAVTRRADILLHLSEVTVEQGRQLVITGEPIVEAQEVSIAINGVSAGKLLFPNGSMSRQILPISGLLQPGRNTITLFFAHTHTLAEMIPGSADWRPLALHITYVGVE